MKRTVLILVFAMLAAFPTQAQDKPKPETPKADAAKADVKAAPLPTADEILAKYVKALGGKEAIEKTTSRFGKGTFEIEAANITGEVESHQKAPNKFASLFTIPGMGGGGQVFDGVKGWDSSPMTGLRELAGEELATLKREADFHQPLNIKKHFPKIEVKGKEKVGTSEAYVLLVTPAEGGPEKMYFDVTTGLLVRQDSERDSAQGKIAAEEYFDDYRDVGGVKVPHTMKIVSPMFAITIKMSEVKSNVEIDETKFNKPAGN